MSKTRLLAAGVMAALALSACSDDAAGDSSGDAAESADLRVWLNGPDTPQDARDWLKKTFEEEHPGSTLTIEEQEWEGLVERLTTAMTSESRQHGSFRSCPTTS